MAQGVPTAMPDEISICKTGRSSTLLTRRFTAIYGRDGREPSKFLHSIKDALSNLASIHDDRVANFRIHLGNNSSISRLSAYLLLFQHQVSRLQPIRIGYS